MTRLGAAVSIGRCRGVDTWHNVYVLPNGTIQLKSDAVYGSGKSEYNFAATQAHELIRLLRLADSASEDIAEHHEKLTAQSNERLARIIEKYRR